MSPVWTAPNLTPEERDFLEQARRGPVPKPAETSPEMLEKIASEQEANDATGQRLFAKKEAAQAAEKARQD